MTLDFAGLFDQWPAPAMVVDRQFRCVAVNRAYLELTRRRAEELVGRDVFEAFPNASATAAAVKGSFERVFSHGKMDEVAAIMTRPRDGALADRVWTARHAPILGADGQVAFVLQETVEVTRLQAHVAGENETLEATIVERALRAQETATHLNLELRDLREMFAQAPGIMCFLRGPEHVFEIVNAAYLQLVGHRDLLGLPVREALPETVVQGFLELLDDVYRTGEPFLGNDIRVMLQRLAGSEPHEAYLDFIYQPIRGRSGEVIGIFVQGQDVSARHRTDGERRLAEARRRFLIEVMPVQVWTARPDGKLDFVSKRVIEYFQRSAQEIVGDGWIAVLHPDDAASVIERWTRTLTTGEPYEVEFRLRRSDGQYRWHLGRANAERASDGTITSWVGTNTDVHDAKMVLHELTMRSQYEQRVIGIVGHDLRNPLNAISLATTLLAQRAPDPAAEKLVARIARAADRATRLVGDLLDFAKARLGTTIPVNPRPTNLHEIVETVVDEFDATAPGRVICVAHSGEESGVWDADRLSQVLSNLIGNALQHGAKDTPVYVEATMTDHEAVLTVVNEGAGIPEHELPHLFEPYRRSSTAVSARGSLGLGLYIAREVIAAHGGTIEVDSSPGKVTCFTVRLPRYAEAATGTRVDA